MTFRRFLTGLFATVALAALISPALGEGFYDRAPAGSWVIVREDSVFNDKKQTQRLKHVIIDALPTLATYRDTGSGFGDSPDETAPPAAPETPPQRRMKITAVADETLTIDGKAYPCKVTTFASPLEEVTYWICPTVEVPYYEVAADGPDLAVPPRTLKVQYVTRLGTEKVTNLIQIIAFNEVLTIDGQPISCVQQKITGSGFLHKKPVAVSGYTWLSSAVPGTVVKHSFNLSHGPLAIDYQRQVEQFSISAPGTPGTPGTPAPGSSAPAPDVK
jgi:hypothetical protein